MSSKGKRYQSRFDKDNDYDDDLSQNGNLRSRHSNLNLDWDVAAYRARIQSIYSQQYEVQEQLRLAAVQVACEAAWTVLPHFPGVRRAYLFGSLVRPGDMRRNADIDIAVEGQLSATDFFALWRKLEEFAHGWTIDLVDLKDHEVPFNAELDERGIVIYERDDATES